MAKRLAKKIFRMFKKFGFVGYSAKKNIFGLHPLLISTTYILITITFFWYLRKLVKIILGDNVFREMVLEILTTIEMCTAFFELIIITENWGLTAYAIFLFILTIIWELLWTDASACPYSTIEEVIEGKMDHSSAALRIFGQLVGGLATFSFVQLFWAMELSQTHKGKAFEACTADLQVSMIFGALIEAIGTCLCRLSGRISSLSGSKWGSIMNSFCSTMIVVAAFDFSGGYYNPALATSMKLGCKGNTFVEHMVVYWVGAILGSVASIYIFRNKGVQNYIESLKIKED